MAINENSFKPTLEINNNRELSNISGLIADKIKNSNISISNNNMTDSQRINFLQNENLELKSFLLNLQLEINELENNLNYSEYRINHKNLILFDKKLLEKNIKFTVKPCDLTDSYGVKTSLTQHLYYSVIYRVHSKDMLDFIKIWENFKTKK